MCSVQCLLSKISTVGLCRSSAWHDRVDCRQLHWRLHSDSFEYDDSVYLPALHCPACDGLNIGGKCRRLETSPWKTRKLSRLPVSSHLDHLDFESYLDARFNLNITRMALRLMFVGIIDLFDIGLLALTIEIVSLGCAVIRVDLTVNILLFHSTWCLSVTKDTLDHCYWEQLTATESNSHKNSCSISIWQFLLKHICVPRRPFFRRLVLP